MKSVKNLAAAVLLGVLFIVVPAQAQEQMGALAPGTVTVLATVNVQDAKIVSQSDNTLELSFTLSNGSGEQPGVKYGVRLVKVGDAVSAVMDEKVYDKIVSIGANEKISDNLTYIAPDHMRGNYDVFIVAKNQGGLELGVTKAGVVELSGTGQNVEIVNSSCLLKVQGEKDGKTYIPVQGVDINMEETLIASCDIVNHFNRSVTVEPVFATHWRTSFGEVVADSAAKKMKPVEITLTAGQKAQISVELPKAEKPQAYDTILTLQEGDKNVSNAMSFHYVLWGASATIQNVMLDKDQYATGDTAVVDIIFTSSASNFPEARLAAIHMENVKVFIAIKDNQGNDCAQESQKDINSNQLKYTEEIAITKICVSPAVTVRLANSEGGEQLDSQTFQIKTKTVAGKPIAEGTLKSNQIIKYFLIITIILILGIILSSIFKKRKAALRIIFLVGLGSLFLGVMHAQAVTFSVAGEVHGQCAAKSWVPAANASACAVSDQSTCENKTASACSWVVSGGSCSGKSAVMAAAPAYATQISNTCTSISNKTTCQNQTGGAIYSGYICTWTDLYSCAAKSWVPAANASACNGLAQSACENTAVNICNWSSESTHSIYAANFDKSEYVYGEMVTLWGTGLGGGCSNGFHCLILDDLTTGKNLFSFAGLNDRTMSGSESIAMNLERSNNNPCVILRGHAFSNDGACNTFGSQTLCYNVAACVPNNSGCAANTCTGLTCNDGCNQIFGTKDCTPTASLTVNPASVNSGDSTTLSWSSTNASSCTASASPANAQWTGSVNLSGTKNITNLTATTTFTINCSGATSSKVVTIAAVVNGICGGYATSSPYVYTATGWPATATTYCATGTASSSPTFPIANATTTWNCVGSGTGHTDAIGCSAFHQTQTATCGGYATSSPYAYTAIAWPTTGTTYCSATGNLRTTPGPTFPPQGSTVNWNCDGADALGTYDDAPLCSAFHQIQAACGTAAKTYAYSDSGWGSNTACISGNTSNPSPLSSITFPAAGSSASWTCTGSAASSVTCTAAHSADRNWKEVTP